MYWNRTKRKLLTSLFSKGQKNSNVKDLWKGWDIYRRGRACLKSRKYICTIKCLLRKRRA